ncbi:3-hydroxybutyryl-CoA dehydrogenase [Prauserella flavalba]|uniref:3-hydroxybutyryl-CoA dehydrogenase n=1 Tax=Prauserella flavalba TaxID=1477506 RepID=UPI0036E574F3
MEFDQVGVIGGGAMGTGIAEVVARAGCDVVLVDVSHAALDASHDRLTTSVAKAVARKKITGEQRDALLSRVIRTTNLDNLRPCSLVIEAVAEDESVKGEVFRRLDMVVGPNTVVATNTSALSVTRLAAAMSAPERFLGLHFFNPAPVLRLVEVIDAQVTSRAVSDRVAAFVSDDLGGKVIRTHDRPGFVVNALLTPYLLSAIRLLEQHGASASDIDLGMVEGCAHPIGPLHLADLVGLDTLVAASEAMYAALREPQYCPPPLLVRMVEAGLLGVKSGRGFFEYN